MVYLFECKECGNSVSKEMKVKEYEDGEFECECGGELERVYSGIRDTWACGGSYK